MASFRSFLQRHVACRAAVWSADKLGRVRVHGSQGSLIEVQQPHVVACQLESLKAALSRVDGEGLHLAPMVLECVRAHRLEGGRRRIQPRRVERRNLAVLGERLSLSFSVVALTPEGERYP